MGVEDDLAFGNTVQQYDRQRMKKKKTMRLFTLTKQFRIFADVCVLVSSEG